MGYLVFTQATLTAGTANVGSGFPRSGVVRTPSLSVTACESNAGSIYIYGTPDGAATPPQRAVAAREQQMIPLTAGQSFQFTGVERGGGAVRDITFGAPYTWIFGSAAGQGAVITYYKWDK